MPAAVAMSSAPACALSLPTRVNSTGSRPASRAAISAARLLPRPEASAAMRKRRSTNRSGDVDALVARGGDDRADYPGVQAVGGQQRLRGVDLVAREKHREANAAVERAPHFFAGDVAFALQPLEHGRQFP